jgi:hypothetical protein
MPEPPWNALCSHPSWRVIACAPEDVMRVRLLTALVAFVLVLPAAARAQDFGVAESAETIDRGNFKVKINPILVFGRDGADHEPGVAGSIGYGFTRRFDAEFVAAIYDGMAAFGGTGEVWLVRDPAVDVSVIGGLHFHRGDNTADLTAFDLTLLASRHLTPRVELYGALDVAWENFDDSDASFKRVHFVPGLEVKLNDDLDFLVEVGLAVNDNANHYISGGLAFYLR